jgi:hypothetical protein
MELNAQKLAATGCNHDTFHVAVARPAACAAYDCPIGAILAAHGMMHPASRAADLGSENNRLDVDAKPEAVQVALADSSPLSGCQQLVPVGPVAAAIDGSMERNSNSQQQATAAAQVRRVMMGKPNSTPSKLWQQQQQQQQQQQRRMTKSSSHTAAAAVAKRVALAERCKLFMQKEAAATAAAAAVEADIEQTNRAEHQQVQVMDNTQQHEQSRVVSALESCAVQHEGAADAHVDSHDRQGQQGGRTSSSSSSMTRGRCDGPCDRRQEAAAAVALEAAVSASQAMSSAVTAAASKVGLQVPAGKQLLRQKPSCSTAGNGKVKANVTVGVKQQQLQRQQQRQERLRGLLQRRHEKHTPVTAHMTRQQQRRQSEVSNPGQLVQGDCHPANPAAAAADYECSAAAASWTFPDDEHHVGDTCQQSTDAAAAAVSAVDAAVTAAAVAEDNLVAQVYKMQHNLHLLEGQLLQLGCEFEQDVHLQ